MSYAEVVVSCRGRGADIQDDRVWVVSKYLAGQLCLLIARMFVCVWEGGGGQAYTQEGSCVGLYPG